MLTIRLAIIVLARDLLDVTAFQASCDFKMMSDFQMG
jgi:hypothetical protein